MKRVPGPSSSVVAVPLGLARNDFIDPTDSRSDMVCRHRPSNPTGREKDFDRAGAPKIACADKHPNPASDLDVKRHDRVHAMPGKTRLDKVSGPSASVFCYPGQTKDRA